MSILGVEWARLTPEAIVVATAERAWLHPHGVWGPFVQPMTSPGLVDTTRRLLDAAARVGWATARRPPEPAFTTSRWAYRLCGFYHTTHATPPLMREAAERFAAAGRTALAAWAEMKAREEQGHDTLVLRDLRALGYDAEAAVQAVVPPVPAALVSHFERQVRSEHPVGCVGYTYALERLALEVDLTYIMHIESCLPEGARATRCLRVHSAAGSDRKHVEETVELVATLPGADRARIARACYETAALCYAAPEGEPPAEEDLQRRLAPLYIDRRKRP